MVDLFLWAPELGHAMPFHLVTLVVLEGVVPALAARLPPPPLHPHSSCSQSVQGYAWSEQILRISSSASCISEGQALFQMPGIETRTQ